MKDSTILLLVILTVFIYGTLQLRAEVEIPLEAELANEIVDPMIVTEDENCIRWKIHLDGGSTRHRWRR